MKNSFYLLTILLGVAITFFCFNFAAVHQEIHFMTSPMIFCYVPFVFGLYGLSTNKLKKCIALTDKNPMEYFISIKEKKMIIWLIFLTVINGVIGLIFYLLPLSLTDKKSKRFDLRVAYSASFIWFLMFSIYLIMHTSA